jgi:hypothetical protein
LLSEISPIMGLVWELLLRQRPTEINKNVYISDMQLMASEPTAARTSWAAMNDRGGLTVTVPLSETSEADRLMLPGWHQSVWRAMQGILKYGGPVKWKSEIGDVLISDGRLMMRETANKSFSACNASLVIRFDWEDKKPTLTHPLKMAFYNFLAGSLELIGKVQACLPSK